MNNKFPGVFFINVSPKTIFAFFGTIFFTKFHVEYIINFSYLIIVFYITSTC